MSIEFRDYDDGSFGRLCAQCGQDAARFAPVGPIYVEISDEVLFTNEEVGCEAFDFCSWACGAQWFSKREGEQASKRFDEHPQI
jgi:hypothetical protein